MAREAVANAVDINNAHNVILSQHRKMFLASTLRINPNGTSIAPSLLPQKLKRYKSVKSIAQYNYIIELLKNWGDDTFLKDVCQPTPMQMNSGFTVRKTSRDTILSSSM